MRQRSPGVSSETLCLHGTGDVLSRRHWVPCHRPLFRLLLHSPWDQGSAPRACSWFIRAGPLSVQGQQRGRQVGSLAVSSGHCHPPDSSGSELCLGRQPYRLLPAYTGCAHLWDTLLGAPCEDKGTIQLEFVHAFAFLG